MRRTLWSSPRAGARTGATFRVSPNPLTGRPIRGCGAEEGAMAVSQHIQHDSADTFSQALEFVRTTVIGGALFLLPIFAVLLVLGKVLGVMVGLTEPLVSALGVTSLGGIAVSNLITISGRQVVIVREAFR